MPTPLFPTLLVLAMCAAAVSIAHEDHRTTSVSVWKLWTLAALAAAFAALAPFPGTPRLEHVIGGVLAGGAGAFIGWGLGKRLGRIAFGGADSWILAAGGLALGMQWVGPWMGACVLVGVAGFVLRIGRPDPELDDGRPILPFAPILLGVLLALLVGRTLGWLPPRPF